MSVGMGLMSFVFASRVAFAIPRRTELCDFDLMVSSRGCDEHEHDCDDWRP